MRVVVGALVLAASGLAVPASADDADADTTAIVNLLVRDRLAARGEAPDGSYLVVAAETIVLCPPRSRDDEPGDTREGFSLSAMVEGSGVFEKAPEPLRRELLCQQEGGMLPTARLDDALVVSETQISAAFSGEGFWDDFYRAFPGSRGYLEFTAPAFSANRREALIYFSHSCGGLCGTGWLVHLSRDAGGAWKIESRQMLWIS